MKLWSIRLRSQFDDKKLIRDGISSLLNAYNKFEIQQAVNGADFLNSLKTYTPDVVLMDLEMPEMGGDDASEYLSKHHPQMKILILTLHGETELAFHMIQRGAHGFLDKDTGIDSIAEAIQAVLKPPGYYFNKYLSEETLSTILASKASNSKVEFFTDREERILELICSEFSNKQIADKLCLSEKTVERERAIIMKKAGKRSIAGIVGFHIKRQIWNKFWFKTKRK